MLIRSQSPVVVLSYARRVYAVQPIAMLACATRAMCMLCSPLPCLLVHVVICTVLRASRRVYVVQPIAMHALHAGCMLCSSSPCLYSVLGIAHDSGDTGGGGGGVPACSSIRYLFVRRR